MKRGQHCWGAGEGPVARIRLLVACSLLSVLFGSVLLSAARKSHEDLTVIFVYAPRKTVPDEHVEQVKIFKSWVPSGSTVFYIMSQPEAWQFGIWQRSLYPDYSVIPVYDSRKVAAADFEALRSRHRVRYALSAGHPPMVTSFAWQIRLPDYPHSIPIVLGRFGVNDVGR
jgi:hypothetical protein